jgi:hypothetical protein
MNKEKIMIVHTCCMVLIDDHIRKQAQNGYGSTTIHMETYTNHPALGIKLDDPIYKPVKECVIRTLTQQLGFRVVEDKNEQLCVIWNSEA